MDRLSRTLLLTAALLLPGGLSMAGHPSYLILQTPAQPRPHQPTYPRYPGTGFAVSTPSYSYGWFGAHPKRQWARQFGYYRNYTQWSGK